SSSASTPLVKRMLPSSQLASAWERSSGESTSSTSNESLGRVWPAAADACLLALCRRPPAVPRRPDESVSCHNPRLYSTPFHCQPVCAAHRIIGGAAAKHADPCPGFSTGPLDSLCTLALTLIPDDRVAPKPEACERRGTDAGWTVRRRMA